MLKNCFSSLQHRRYSRAKAIHTQWTGMRWVFSRVGWWNSIRRWVKLVKEIAMLGPWSWSSQPMHVIVSIFENEKDDKITKHWFRQVSLRWLMQTSLGVAANAIFFFIICFNQKHVVQSRLKPQGFQDKVYSLTPWVCLLSSLVKGTSDSAPTRTALVSNKLRHWIFNMLELETVKFFYEIDFNFICALAQLESMDIDINLFNLPPNNK